MKRIDLIRKIEDQGCVLIRHGDSQPVPRHREVSELLAKHIIRKLQS